LIFFPTGQNGDDEECIPIIFFIAFGSTAIQIWYNVIAESGIAIVAPPVPNLTVIIPAFFKELTILRMVTGLHPVDKDSSSLVTFFSVPYSLIKIRQ
jgi:hypothetical protein